jgi:hypothetical protein
MYELQAYKIFNETFFLVYTCMLQTQFCIFELL